jgi:hypothetical protein
VMNRACRTNSHVELYGSGEHANTCFFHIKAPLRSGSGRGRSPRELMQ